jgi:hypothetical protein
VTQTKLTPKQLLDRMRKLTADLLGYDLTNLTPAQSVRLDRAAAIRLMLDDVQSRQLAGLDIDMTKFVAASEVLERMLDGGDPEQPRERRSPAPPLGKRNVRRRRRGAGRAAPSKSRGPRAATRATK